MSSRSKPDSGVLRPSRPDHWHLLRELLDPIALYRRRPARPDDPPQQALIGKGVRFVQRIFRLRLIGLGIGFFCVAAGFLQYPVAWPLWLLLAAHGYLWPHLARYWALKSAIPYRAERRNLIIDAAFGGFWIAALNGNLVPSAVIFSMLSMDNIAAGGLRLFMRGLYASILTGILAWWLLGAQLQPQSDLLTILACLPMMALYPLALGQSTYAMSKKLAERSRQFEIVSQLDGLTLLFNRRYWENLLAAEFERRRQGHAPAHQAFLLLLDLDHFKSINDTHGHLIGDEVLRNFSRLLRASLREDDLIGRYGGEEFVVILRDIQPGEALALSQRLVEAARAANDENNLYGCTVSAGLVPFSTDMEAYFVWLQRADHAMYCAKESGRDRLVVWNERLERKVRAA
ncbi:diguanylate cyclase [Herbaspirillum rubrisubalbicans]|uniref:diguanylate cyclase n=1 Tax=Herbaspirillum rubrisubalbicans TaxID=80842 RepID=UPI00209FD56D|nr:diguanylate cyclase [Herbaspirillum rubrisubalbicans]MCP1573824.1 diguanylate cyclase [Herbaspirillum rubrisubalbicans]